MRQCLIPARPSGRVAATKVAPTQTRDPPPGPSRLSYRLLRYPFFFRLGASLGFDANGSAAWSFLGTGSALNLRGFRSIGLYRES